MSLLGLRLASFSGSFQFLVLGSSDPLRFCRSGEPGLRRLSTLEALALRTQSVSDMGILRQQPHGFRIADDISTFVLPTRLWIASVLP